MACVVAYKAPFLLLINPTQFLHQQKPVVMKRQQRQFSLPSPGHGLAGMESDKAVGKLCGVMRYMYYFRLALC